MKRVHCDTTNVNTVRPGVRAVSTRPRPPGELYLAVLQPGSLGDGPVDEAATEEIEPPPDRG
jgi:hypothetical protein